jgi:hypothetical protein
VAAVPDRLSRAIPFHPLEPFDRYGFTDLVVASRRAAAQASLHRVNHPVAQVLRIRLRHSCWPPPSQQVESKYPRFGNPTPDSNQKQHALGTGLLTPAIPSVSARSANGRPPPTGDIYSAIRDVRLTSIRDVAQKPQMRQ